MSWHFSRALVEDFSRATCSDGERFAPLRSTTTREAYCWRDKTTESLDLFQYGMTLQPSTQDLGAELLTWCREGFRASTSASRAQCGAATDWTAKKVDCGSSTSASSTSVDPDTYSGKTHPPLKTKGSVGSFERWPSAGTFQDGQLLGLPALDSGTREGGSGFLLPTPTARDWKDTPGMTDTRLDGKTRNDRLPMLLFSVVRSAGIECRSTTPTDARTVSVKGLIVTIRGPHYSPELPEWIMGWPIGWTDLSPLEMDRFRQWQREHGGCFRGLVNE